MSIAGLVKVCVVGHVVSTFRPSITAEVSFPSENTHSFTLRGRALVWFGMVECHQFLNIFTKKDYHKGICAFCDASHG